MNCKLPLAVERQASDADKQINALARARVKRGGRPNTRNHKRKSLAGFVADTPEELEERLRILHAVLGPKRRGNKRYGRAAFYADLVECFLRLRSKGITPPKGGSLSRKACKAGITALLEKHELLNPEETQRIAADATLRNAVGRENKREFTRVANAITPHK